MGFSLLMLNFYQISSIRYEKLFSTIHLIKQLLIHRMCLARTDVLKSYENLKICKYAKSTILMLKICIKVTSVSVENLILYFSSLGLALDGHISTFLNGTILWTIKTARHNLYM